MPAADPKERVQSYWERTTCSLGYASEVAGTPEFYAEIDQRRERLEPFIAEFAGFSDADGKRVLEVGVGIGSNFLRFVRAGVIATGIDLTAHAVWLVERRFALEGLSAELKRADAENLPFADDAFDVGYSWDVLHHTPDTEHAVPELIRARGQALCDGPFPTFVGDVRIVASLWARSRPALAFSLQHPGAPYGERRHSRLHAQGARSDVHRR